MHALFLVLKVRATDMVTKSASQKLFHLPEPAQVKSSLVFTQSPQPYFPFPIRVTIAGDGLGDAFKNILPIRVQDKHEIFI